MATKNKFPRRIENMIENGWANGLSSAEVTRRVNTSATAKRLGVSYSRRSIAAKFANLSRV